MLGTGGAALGMLLEDDDSQRRRGAAVAAVQRAVELGVRYFDTSPAYGGSLAERHLGAGLAALDPVIRAEIVVSTKVGTHPQRRGGYGAEDIRWSYENSREILGPIDIVFVHDPRSDEDMDTILAPGGAFEVLEELKAGGQIRALGLGVRRHRYLRRAIESGRADVILPSYDYHPIRQSLEPLLAVAAGAGVGVVNGSPYQAGLLAGIDLSAPVRRPSDGDLARARQIYAWCAAREVEVGALAVQFSLRQGRISSTLTGPRTVAEVEDSIRHATASIGEAIWEELADFLSTLQPPPVPGGEAQ